MVRLSLGAVALSSLVSSALASFGGPMVEVAASNASGSGSFQVSFDERCYNAVTGEYRWTLPEGVQIRSASNEVIASIESLSLYFVDDPIITMGFVATAGSSDTHFTLTSATLSFAAIDPAQGQTSAGVSVTDADGNGATYTGMYGDGTSYHAEYNGFPGSLFKSLISGFSVAPRATDTRSGNYGFVPIGTPVTDMTSQWDFTLSANDLAAGTSRYEIIPVPEPGAMAALGLGALALLRRRRK